MIKEYTWQQFRNDIKNKTFMHEGKSTKGLDLPMSKQKTMYSTELHRRLSTSEYINSGIKNV